MKKRDKESTYIQEAQKKERNTERFSDKIREKVSISHFS